MHHPGRPRCTPIAAGLFHARTSVPLLKNSLAYSLVDTPARVYCGAITTNHMSKEHIMGKRRSFTDADGDTYTTQLSDSGHNITITYENEDGSGVSMLIFKLEDAPRIANNILNAALEARS